MKTQNERLLDRLQKGPVDPMEALSELSIFRLAARVRDLKDAGHNITAHSAKVTNRYGEPCRVARYELIA